MPRRFLTASFLRPDFDLALLVPRIGVGVNLFLKHGLEKIANYTFFTTHFTLPSTSALYTPSLSPPLPMSSFPYSSWPVSSYAGAVSITSEC